MNVRLREILNERGISIRAFAQLLGVAPNSLPVNDTYKPTLTALQRYATELHIPVVDLVHKPDGDAAACGNTDGRDINDVALANIRNVMKQRGMTMLALAKKMGVSNPSLSHTFKYNKMGIATLEKIARGLDVEAWTLLVDAAAQPTPTTFDPHDPSEIQTVTDVINNEKLTVNNELRADKPLGKQVNVGGSFEDLFAQQPEQQEVQMQEGVTYVCGNTRITIVNGVMEIRVQDKKAI